MSAVGHARTDRPAPWLGSLRSLVRATCRRGHFRWAPEYRGDLDVEAADRWLRICHFPATIHAMKTTIDAAGRIVVPKSLRQALGLKPGQPLQMRAGDGRLEIEIAATPVRLMKRGKGMVAVPETVLPPLTADQVRDTLERVRR
jgi:AbrB family looped-hinge helix DNA binding protein